eukprot:g19.t1
MRRPPAHCGLKINFSKDDSDAAVYSSTKYSIIELRKIVRKTTVGEMNQRLTNDDVDVDVGALSSDEERNGQSKINRKRSACVQLSARAGHLYQMRALTHPFRSSRKKKNNKDKNPRKSHTWLYSMLNGKSRKPQSKYFKAFVTTVICISVLSFILSTEPAFDDASFFFDFCEAFSSCVFLLELAARAYVVTEKKKSKYHHWIRGRVRFLLSFEAMVDLLASLPWFLETIMGAAMKDASLPTFTWVRMIRLFRLLKTEKYTKAFESVYRVVWFNRGILMVALLICVMLMLTTSTILYYIAKLSDDMEGNSDFTSIPASLYLSVMMLTGQGGPEGTIPWFMKILCALTAIFSVPVFVIPSSMLTWGFEAEAERMMAKDRERRLRLKRSREAGETIITTSSSSTSAHDSGEISSDVWEAYEKVILGDKDEDAGATKSDSREIDRTLEKLFRRADVDDDGKVTQEELRNVARRSSSPVRRKILDRVDRVFRSIDADASGGVCLEEFLDHAAQVRTNGGGEETLSVAPTVAARMDRMERQIRDVNDKLDRALKLLESRRSYRYHIRNSGKHETNERDGNIE